MPINSKLNAMNGPNLRIKLFTGEVIEGAYTDIDTDNIEYVTTVPSVPPQQQTRVIPFTGIQEFFTALIITSTANERSTSANSDE